MLFCLFLWLIYFWLCWVFVAGCRLSLVAVSRVCSSLRSVSSAGMGFGSCSIQAQSWWCMGPVALWPVEPSQTRGQTHVPCIGRGTLNHWTTEGIPVNVVLLSHCLVLVAQSCPTLYNPRDCSPPDSPVHGLLQARILEWVAVSFGDIFLYSNR